MERKYDRLCKSFFGIGIAIVCVLLLLPALRVVPAGAQNPPPTGTAGDQALLERRIESFFGLLRDDDFPRAFDVLLAHSSFATTGASQPVANLQSEIRGLISEFGDILHWERIDVQPRGTNVLVIRYVLKHERFPVIFSFAFYRRPTSAHIPLSLSNPNQWGLAELQFETSLL